MKVNVKQVKNLTFAAIGDTGHWVPMDVPVETGGFGGAAKPMELILMAMGGCTGMDVASILAKMRSPVDDMEISIEAEQAETHPKVFTKIRLQYKIYGEVQQKNVEEAIALSETKYCSVMAMLRKTVEIVTSYKILPKKEES